MITFFWQLQGLSSFLYLPLQLDRHSFLLLSSPLGFQLQLLMV